jgi:hypothetical protein
VQQPFSIIVCLGYKGYLIKEYFANYVLPWNVADRALAKSIQ